MKEYKLWYQKWKFHELASDANYFWLHSTFTYFVFRKFLLPLPTAAYGGMLTYTRTCRSLQKGENSAMITVPRQRCEVSLFSSEAKQICLSPAFTEAAAFNSSFYVPQISQESLTRSANKL